MVLAQKEKSTIAQGGAPDYWPEISEALNQAKRLLWARIQRGEYHDDEEARSTMEAYSAVKKILKLQETKMRQIPFPEEEHDGNR